MTTVESITLLSTPLLSVLRDVLSRSIVRCMQPRNSLAAALGKSFEEEREKVVNFYRDINGDLSAVENITSSYRCAD